MCRECAVASMDKTFIGSDSDFFGLNVRKKIFKELKKEFCRNAPSCVMLTQVISYFVVMWHGLYFFFFFFYNPFISIMLSHKLEGRRLVVLSLTLTSSCDLYSYRYWLGDPSSVQLLGVDFVMQFGLFWGIPSFFVGYPVKNH